MKGEGETQQKIADALVCRDRDRAQDGDGRLTDSGCAARVARRLTPERRPSRHNGRSLE
jgi:hypothetical protein